MTSVVKIVTSSKRPLRYIKKTIASVFRWPKRSFLAIGNIKGWVVTIIYTKYSNLDALEALEHDFIANPLTYISY